MNPSSPENGKINPVEQENIIRIETSGKVITLVGTAHISRQSAQQVERVIEEAMPDTVCVELCQARYDAIRQPQGWQEMDIIKLIREKKAALLLTQWIVAAYQRKLARQMDIRPGEEMFRALTKAEEIGARVVLADRDIRVTLTRTWRAMSFIGKIRLVAEVITAMLFAEKVTEEDIEKLKKQDVLDHAVEMLRKKLPTVKTTLIDERDLWLACRIGEAPGERIVAVVGAGHLSGVARHLGTDPECSSLNEIPPPSPWVRAAAWTIPALIIGLILAGFFFAEGGAVVGMIVSWTVITATASALGAMVLLAHPATILASAVAAPLTTLHPFLAAGWVAGVTEATMRKPQVKDFMSLSDDIMSWRGFFRNKITRVLMIVALVNITASLGAFVAIPAMMRYL